MSERPDLRGRSGAIIQINERWIDEWLCPAPLQRRPELRAGKQQSWLEEKRMAFD